MAKLKIKTTFETVSEESSRDGDFADHGWLDKEGKTFDNAKEAARFLKDEGVMESSSSCYHDGVWYSTEPQQNVRTGDYSSMSFHISGGTSQQRKKLDELVMGKRQKCGGK